MCFVALTEDRFAASNWDRMCKSIGCSAIEYALNRGCMLNMGVYKYTHIYIYDLGVIRNAPIVFDLIAIRFEIARLAEPEVGSFSLEYKVIFG